MLTLFPFIVLILMMTNFEKFSVYRPVTGESLEQLNAVQRQYAAVPSFDPVEVLHLTLMGGNNGRMIPITRRQWILKNAPDTLAAPYEMEAESVRIDPHLGHVGRLAIRLLLATSNVDTYETEHRYFIDTANRTAGVAHTRTSSPHVTIGHIDEWYALDSITGPLNDTVGSTLHFGPAASPSAPEAQLPLKTTRKPEKGRSGDSTPREVTRINSERRTISETPRAVTPGSIPSGLLAAMRGTKSSN